MEVIHYDHAFNGNEWFVIISMIILYYLIWKLPKIMSTSEAIAYTIYGMFIVVIHDHNMGVGPFDYYDVNDSSAFQFMDFLSYIMFGPYSYILIWLYIKLNIRGYQHILYILAWTSLAILIEWLTTKIGLYHYKNGYSIYYSIPIYLGVQTLQLVIYNLHSREKRMNSLNKNV